MNQEKACQIIKDLDSLGISIAEFNVLAVVLMYPPLLKEIAKATFNELRGDRFEQPLEMYVKAVATCLQRGWIHEVSPKDYAAQVVTLSRESPPVTEDDFVAEPGSIDLTALGYELYRQAAARYYGPARHAVRYVTSELRVEIYSDSDADCRDYARWYLDNKVDYFNGPEGEPDVPVAFDHVEGPSPIGAWRYNRFEVVPRGFRMSLQYARTSDSADTLKRRPERSEADSPGTPQN